MWALQCQQKVEQTTATLRHLSGREALVLTLLLTLLLLLLLLLLLHALMPFTWQNSLKQSARSLPLYLRLEGISIASKDTCVAHT